MIRYTCTSCAWERAVGASDVVRQDQVVEEFNKHEASRHPEGAGYRIQRVS